jgi:DNA-binding transcriptional LysR family regulator
LELQVIPYAAYAPALRRFEARFPDLELTVRHPSQDDVLQLVIEGEAALGLNLVQTNYPKTIAFCRLGDITLTNAVHRDHPLAAMKDITFAQLCDYRQLIVTPHGKRLPTSEYLQSPRSWLVESYLVLLEMAKDGLGWAILPKRLIQQELASGVLHRHARADILDACKVAPRTTARTSSSSDSLTGLPVILPTARNTPPVSMTFTSIMLSAARVRRARPIVPAPTCAGPGAGAA